MGERPMVSPFLSKKWVAIFSKLPGYGACYSAARRYHYRSQRKPVKGVSELQKTIESTKPGSNLLFLVKRSGNSLFLAMNVAEKDGESRLQ
jgi:hypothetical protein